MRTASRPGLSTLLVSAALLLMALYPLSYLALATPEFFYPTMQTLSGSQYVCRVPHYRFGGERAETLFRPLERLDRWARPHYWHPFGFEPVLDLEGGLIDINVENPLEIEPSVDENEPVPPSPALSAQEEGSP